MCSTECNRKPELTEQIDPHSPGSKDKSKEVENKEDEALPVLTVHVPPLEQESMTCDSVDVNALSSLSSNSAHDDTSEVLIPIVANGDPTLNSSTTEESAYMTTISKSYKSRLVNEAMQFRKMISTNKTQIYRGTLLGKMLLGALVALCPQSSLENLEVVVSLARASFLADVGLPVHHIVESGRSSPSASTLLQVVKECATDSMYIAASEILEDGCKVYLICDKGAKKGDHTHFVKLLSWYSRRDDRIKTFMIDTDDSDGHSDKCAMAIKHSLVKMFGEENVENILHGQMTDSGGGGTGNSFHRELSALSLTRSEENYVQAFCTLHCIQLTLSAPVKDCIGEGGYCAREKRYSRNAMQLLHGLWNLQAHHEDSEFEDIWTVAAQHVAAQAAERTGIQAPIDLKAKFSKIPCPILTRWWTVGVAAEYAVEHWDTLLELQQGVINRDATSKAANQIASGNQSLMQTRIVRSDVVFLSNFHKYYLFDHFEWLQRGDMVVGGSKAGFLNRHIGVRYFLMYTDLSDAFTADHWKALPAFEEYVASIEALSSTDKDSQIRKTRAFFKQALEQLHKHFARWLNELLFLSLYSESWTAMCVAKFLLTTGQQTVDWSHQDLWIGGGEEFESDLHGRSINLKRFGSFVTGKCRQETKDMIQQSHYFAQWKDAIKKISEGSNLWCIHPTPLLRQFRQHYLETYAALPSNSHLAESNVKEANHCSIHGRTEHLCSIYSTARAGVVEELNARSLETMLGKQMRGNQYVSSGTAGCRKQKSDGSDFDENVYKRRAKGSVKSVEAINLVMERLQKVTESMANPQAKVMRERIAASIGKKDCQFKQSRVECKVEQFKESLQKVKEPNALQKAAGSVDTTLKMSGRILFSKLLMSRDKEEVKKELQYRGLSTEGGWMKDLLERLKQDEGDRKSFMPRSTNAQFSSDVWIGFL